MASEAQFDAALDLLRRLPPTQISQNLTNITALTPNLEEDLLSSVDQPLSSARDAKTGRDYLLCDYNRDGDSHRSPWSNEFSPPLDDATYPSDRVRKMEVEANTAFEVYRQMYYEGGTGSVYLWDLDDGFAGVVLLKKKDGKEAGWDSIHVFEVDESSSSRGTSSSRQCHYKLTSTVILHLSSSSEIDLSLAGSMTRQVEADLIPEPSGSLPGKDGGHVVNVGRLVEDMEGKMRNMLQEVYFGKAKDVVGDLRSLRPLGTVGEERSRHKEMLGSMGGGK